MDVWCSEGCERFGGDVGLVNLRALPRDHGPTRPFLLGAARSIPDTGSRQIASAAIKGRVDPRAMLMPASLPVRVVNLSRAGIPRRYAFPAVSNTRARNYSVRHDLIGNGNRLTLMLKYAARSRPIVQGPKLDSALGAPNEPNGGPFL
jgi:hypothetical protein